MSLLVRTFILFCLALSSASVASAALPPTQRKKYRDVSRAANRQKLVLLEQQISICRSASFTSGAEKINLMKSCELAKQKAAAAAVTANRARSEFRASIGNTYLANYNYSGEQYAPPAPQVPYRLRAAQTTTSVARSYRAPRRPTIKPPSTKRTPSKPRKIRRRGSAKSIINRYNKRSERKVRRGPWLFVPRGKRVSCLPSRLLAKLKQVSRHFNGAQVRVVSGGRSRSHNRRVNGARGSLHLSCNAVDFTVAGVSMRRLREYVAATFLRNSGVGFYCGGRTGRGHNNHVHLDVGSPRGFKGKADGHACHPHSVARRLGIRGAPVARYSSRKRRRVTRSTRRRSNYQSAQLRAKFNDSNVGR